MQNYQIIPMLLGREVSSREIRRLSDWKENRYREIIAEKLAPAEGAESLLHDLTNEDFPLAVVAVTTIGKRADLYRADMIVDSLTRLQARRFVKLLKNRKDYRPSTSLTLRLRSG